MLSAVLVALRALRWRAGVSAVALVVAVLAVATAAAGPLYLHGAGDAVVRSTLTGAAGTSAGTGIEVAKDAVGRSGSAPLTGAVDEAVAGTTLVRSYARRLVALERPTRVLDARGRPGDRVTVVARDDTCAHVRLVQGTCVTGAADEIMVSDADARRLRWSVGDRVRVDALRDVDPGPPPPGGTPGGGRVVPADVRVVGTYAPVDPGGAFWFNDTRGYFVGQQRLDEARSRAATRTLEAVFIGRQAFAQLTAGDAVQVRIVEDFLLDPASVNASGIPGLRADLDLFGARIAKAGLATRGLGNALSTGVRDVLDTAQARVAATRVPVTVVLVELVLLALAVLFLVVSDAADTRGGEVALAKVRGLPAGTTLAFGLLETLLVLVCALPLGIAVAWLVVGWWARSLAGAVPAPGVDAATCLAALTALAGGAVAAILASVRTLRRPVVEQWRRTAGRPGRRGLALEAVVVALCVVGLWQVWSAPAAGATEGGARAVALAAPTLLVLAGGLVGARIVPLLATVVAARTRRSRHIGPFVGARELSRRPGGTRVLAVLTTAFGVAVFSVLAAQAFTVNRQDRAATQVGATRVLHVDAAAGVDVAAAVDRLDPGGQQAAAVSEVSASIFGATSADADADGPSRAPFRLLVADPARLAAVGFWRDDFAAGATLGAVTGMLGGPVPQQPTLQGDQVRLTTRGGVACCGPVALRLALVTPDGHAVDVRLGRLARVLTAATPQCARAACTLRRILVDRDAPGAYAAVTDLTVEGVESREAGRWTPVPGASDPGSWTATDDRRETAALERPGADVVLPEPAVRALPAAAGSGVRLSGAVPPNVLTFGLTARTPAAVPAVVTAAYAPTPPSSRYLLSLPSSGLLSVDVRRVVDVLPRAGATGVLVPREAVGAVRALADDGLSPNEVWLGPRAAADFPSRLTAAGVRVTEVEDVPAASRELAQQGPALAADFLVAGALASALLALGAAIVTMYLAGRRRAFELAALRALGVGERGVLSAAVAEQMVVAVTAVGLGAVLGTVAARLGLPGVPEFAEGPVVPPLLVPLDPLLVAATAAVLLLALGGGALVGGVLVTRAAVPARLREGQA